MRNRPPRIIMVSPPEHENFTYMNFQPSRLTRMHPDDVLVEDFVDWMEENGIQPYDDSTGSALDDFIAEEETSDPTELPRLDYEKARLRPSLYCWLTTAEAVIVQLRWCDEAKTQTFS